MADISADKYTRRFESYLTSTDAARQNAETCRDYYNNKQWSDDEAEKLKARKQAPIVVNRIQPKIDSLRGLLINQRADPKAFPRTIKHEKASEAITDALRYIDDNADFDHVEQSCAEDFFVEGTCAAIVEIDKKRNVAANRIPWDRFYYDPHSRELDFSDAKFLGIVLWMDLDDAQEMFPDHAETFTQLVDMSSGLSTETYDDKPIWIDKERKRIRICQEYCKEKGTWKEIFYTFTTVLKHGESPYQDEDGEPINPIVAASAYIDRDLQRFGPCMYWLDLQDEVNHRRSKALHLVSQRQTVSRRGAIQDIGKLKRELAKPDGHVEYDGEPGDFDILNTNDMSQAQFSLLGEAKAELDAVSVNAQLSGERQGAISGAAVQALQAGGMLELAPAMAALQRWRRGCYRQFWYRIKQFWREEKWIRVTDSYDTLKWVGLNHKVTIAEVLKEQADDESLDPELRMQAAQTLQGMAQSQDPRLTQFVETRNEVAVLEMDIILESAPDTLTIQNEQFQLLAQLAASRPEIPFAAILKLSQIREKDAILADIEQRGEQQAQVQQQLAASQAQAAQADAQMKQAKLQIDAAKAEADIANTQVDTAKKQQEAEQTALENQILLNTPVTSTTVAV